MIVGVQGTPNFNNYNIFLRAMAVALSELKDNEKEFYLYSVGPGNINDMAMEFVNLSERGMKSRGKQIKLFRITPQWFEENIDSFNHFVFVSNPKERTSNLVSLSKSKNINTNVYNF
jgi:hypothetical protein